MAGLEPVVVFWTRWSIHFMVLLSFTVQVMLLLLSDIRRRRNWTWLKVVIWSAYMLADTTAIYALGHMSLLCNWSPEHELMALWAPLLLVHLGGQDNITAYSIEDNRLWLRHLQTFVLQVAAAAYVLYVSSILSHPSNSKVRLAAILLFVVGFLKYLERIWALKRSNSCASSSLSATSYDKKVSVSGSSTSGDESDYSGAVEKWNEELIVAYSLLDVPKQMFEGPTSYVQCDKLDSNKVFNKLHKKVEHDVSGAEFMLRVVGMQLSMMYDLLYTKAAVVHTWYGLCSRLLISLPFTVTSLLLFRETAAAAAGLDYYKRADMVVTNVLLVGAVILETMSLLRAIFSKWTAILLYGWGWNTIGNVIFSVIAAVGRAMDRLIAMRLVRTGSYSWSCDMSRRHYWLDLVRMPQHSLFTLMVYSNYSRGSKVAKRMGMEDWWDANVYSWSTIVSERVIEKMLELVSQTTQDITTTSPGLNALRKNMEDKVTLIWTGRMKELKLEDRILVWHIATHVYMEWCRPHLNTLGVGQEAEDLGNYMFFLLAARPYMLPYPVSRQAYVDLCSYAITHIKLFGDRDLVYAILNQKEALMRETPLKFAYVWAPTNATLDTGCQLAAKLIHITAKETIRVNGKDIIRPILETKGAKGKGIAEQAESSGTGNDSITEQAETFTVNFEVVLNMFLEVWVEMLCHTAYWCNEKSHAKRLTDGGDLMTIITLLMIYMKNDTSASGGMIAGPSSSRSLANVPAMHRSDVSKLMLSWPHV